MRRLNNCTTILLLTINAHSFCSPHAIIITHTQIFFPFKCCSYLNIIYTQYVLTINFCSRSTSAHSQLLLFTLNNCSLSTSAHCFSTIIAHTHVLFTLKYSTLSTIAHTQLLLTHNYYAHPLLLTLKYFSFAMIAHTQLLLTRNYCSLEYYSHSSST